MTLAGSTCGLLAGCGNEPGSSVEARDMPAGYEAVDTAFGVRIGGLLHDSGHYTAPVVEFRTKGDYALYPLTTTCDGSFTRGSGTVFTRDGTIKEQVAAQGMQTVAANPQFATVIDRICADAVASRFIPDPFKPQDALILLFGGIDARSEAKWGPSAGDDVGEGVKLVSLRRSGSFTEGDQRFSYVLTGSRDPECEAHVCGGGAIGGALFRFDDGKWVLVSHNPSILISGAYGRAVEADAVRDLHGSDQPPLIRIDSGYCHNGGYCGLSASLVSVVGSRFAEVWSGEMSYDTTSSFECGDSGHCSDWQTQMKLLPSKGVELPGIELTRSGRSWDESREKLFELGGKIVYRYDPAGRYHEVSRTGAPVEIPLPVPPIDADELAATDSTASAEPVEEASGESKSVVRERGNALPDSDGYVDVASMSMNPPRYPPAAARSGIEGTVVLVVDIDAAGNVTNVAVDRSSRNRDLDRAAMDQARRWRFHPAIEEGQPAPARIRVPVDFSLGG